MPRSFEAIVRSDLSGTFMTLDLDQRTGDPAHRFRGYAASRCEGCGPVASRVVVEEHVALARWNDAELWSTCKVKCSTHRVAATLPQFDGPERSRE